MNNDDEWIWPVVIIIVAWVFLQASNTSAAVNLANIQANAAANAAANNNPWLNASAGVGLLGSTLSTFSNLFSSND